MNFEARWNLALSAQCYLQVEAQFLKPDYSGCSRNAYLLCFLSLALAWFQDCQA